MSDSQNASAAPNSAQAVAPVSTPPKDITGAEALAMVQAEKAAKQAGIVPKKAPEASSQETVKEAAAEALRKFKVKVDGEELEVDEDELKRGYSHQKAANKLFQEAKMGRKQAEEFVMMMRDPKTFFETAKKLGHDPRELAEKYLANQLEDELMDPKDKELRELKEFKTQKERDEAEAKQKEEQKLVETLKTKFAKEYSDQFVGALQQSGLPPTKNTVGRMASYISRAAGIGFKMSADDAARLVKEDLAMEHRAIIGDSDGEVLIKYLGEDITNKVRKYDTGRLKNPEANLRTPVEQGKTRERGTPHRRMTPREWRDYNRKA